MSEVQQFPVACFKFILHHHRGFNHDILTDESRQCFFILLIIMNGIFFQLPEKCSIFYGCMFDHFGKSVDPFFGWQGLQKGCIIKKKSRLPDRPHQVFVMPHINAILPTNGGIHHTEYRGRYKSKGDTAHIYGSRKSADIRNNATPNAHNRGFPVCSVFNELINYLADCYDPGDRGIRFEQMIQPVKLDVAQAVPVGLILNEAITNAIKYAFPAQRGEIKVVLQLAEETIILTIADNGIGLPVNFDIQKASSLGMEMMKALSKQLGGYFKIENYGGAIITVEFRAEKMLNNIERKTFAAN